MQAALQRAREGDAGALGDLRMLLHRMAGSAGSYGFDAVTERARAAESAVAGLLSRHAPVTPGVQRDLSDLIEDVRAAFPHQG